MRKVFLVDDEPLITDMITTLVDWNSYGMCICGTANDGITAQRELLKKKPDLVITDIRMPGQNGLELIASVQKELTDTLFVIISGYNDFAYIRAALRLNVIDYLDKPVTIEKIESLLTEAQEIFRKKMDPEQMSDCGRLEHQLEKILTENPGSILELPEMLRGKQTIHAAAFSGETLFLKETLPGVLCELFAKMGITAAVLETDAGSVSVGWSEKSYSEKEVCQALKEELAGYLAEGRISAVGVSSCYETFCALRTAFLEAVCARDYAEFFGDEVIQIGDVPVRSGENRINMVFKDHIGLLLQTGEWEKAEAAVAGIFQQMEALRPNPDLVRHICLEIIYLSISVCSESGQEYMQDDHPLLPHVAVASLTKGSDVKAWTQETFHKIVSCMRERREQAGHKDIARAKRYIDEHYDEAITLQMLADMCYMNPNYFSVIFRDNVGMNYVKYLNMVRMEHAKEMVRSGYKIKVVSEKCGFQNTRYFSEKFKTYTGVTPEQYRLGGEGKGSVSRAAIPQV